MLRKHTPQNLLSRHRPVVYVHVCSLQQSAQTMPLYGTVHSSPANAWLYVVGVDEDSINGTGLCQQAGCAVGGCQGQPRLGSR